ncbi:MerR family transcriptional regulator [Cellulomonas sp. NPDC057328]|uniref:MerR family transcriptional regulator n=1 Tax=Cellulomonas sp. NPDC057328 TaxID=3346101 RepID=UPI003645DE25
MRIGEVAAATGASARSLRHYEQLGLIASRREPNGYRDYDEETVVRVRQIRGLLDSGIPTRVIERMLPCLDGGPDILPDEATPELLAGLERERASLDARIATLVRSREALTGYIATVTAARTAR